MKKKIKNIVFDIGNVMVKWEPRTVVARLFPQHDDVSQLSQSLFKSQTAFDLNLGKITEAEAIAIYHQNLKIDLGTLNQLFYEIKESLVPIEESLRLLHTLHQKSYSLYALTDNVRELMTHMRAKYDFWDKFSGVVVSAEVGYLKPAPEIYFHLINQYNLKPSETVFIDDYLQNVDGARALGMHGIHFSNAEQCMIELDKIL